MPLPTCARAHACQDPRHASHACPRCIPVLMRNDTRAALETRHGGVVLYCPLIYALPLRNVSRTQSTLMRPFDPDIPMNAPPDAPPDASFSRCLSQMHYPCPMHACPKACPEACPNVCLSRIFVPVQHHSRHTRIRKQGSGAI